MIVGLLLLAVVVAVVVLAVRRMSAAGAGHGASSGRLVRHLFQYLLLLGLLVVAASGLSGLLGPLLDGGTTLARSDADLARQLSFTIIGLPLFGVLGWWTLRSLREDPEERRSAGWAAYLTLASVTTLLVAMTGLHETLSAVVGLTGYRGEALARALVWGAAWGAHWWVGRKTAPAAHLQPLHLVGSAVGLGAGAAGLTVLLTATLRILLGLEGSSLVGRSTDALLQGAVLLVVGGAVWVTYWLLAAAREERTPLWLTYVLLVGVGTGLVAAVAAASLLFYEVLVWLVGEPWSSRAAEHFAQVPELLAVVAVGLLVWWYHQAVLAAGRQEARTEVRRVLEYLLSAIGLLAAAAGLTVLLVAVIELLAGERDVLVGGSPVNTVLAAVTLLAVGVPVWWWHWRLAQAAVRTDPAAELASPTRRTYLFVLFGVGGVAAVVALLVLVYLVLRDTLAGDAGAETLRSVRFAVGVLVSTAAVSAYHWAVYRQDREQAPPPPPDVTAPHRYLLVVGPDDAAGLRRLAELTGAEVQLLPRAGEGVAPLDAQAVADAVAADPAPELLVLAEGAATRLIPIRRR